MARCHIHPSVAVLSVLALGALALRLGLALSNDGYLGVDGGAYLLSRNAVLGIESTGEGFPRPPLAPGWLLVPFTALAGNDIGYKLWSVFFSFLPSIPVYLLARRHLGQWPALFASAFLLFDLLHAEMIVTGALPLIGFGFLGLAWWAMGQLAERFNWRDALILAVSVGIIPWINQTTAGLAVVTLPVYFLALILLRKEGRQKMGYRILPPLAMGGIVAMGALPWYLEVLPVTGKLNYPGPWIFPTTPFDLAWVQCLMALPLGAWMIIRGQGYRFRALGGLVALLGTLVVFLSTDETIINVFYRSRYLMAIPFYVGITALVWRVWGPWVMVRLNVAPANLEYQKVMRKTILTSITIIFLMLMAFGYVSQFQRQAVLSAMGTRETVEALQVAAETDAFTAESGIITNSFTLSLWVAALNRVPSPNTWNRQPPVAYQESDRHVRCILGWIDGCDAPAAAAALGTGWVLIDTRFPYYNKRAPGIYGAPESPWENLPNLPWLEMAYQDGTTELWRVRDG